MSTNDELSSAEQAELDAFDSATDKALAGDFSELEAMLPDAPESEGNFFIPALKQIQKPMFHMRGNKTRH